MVAKLRVLFVDDEPDILAELRRTLSSMQGEWEMEFSQGGAQALEVLNASEESFDVVVTDLRMPGMDGARLLDYVRDCHPHLIRIVSSGQSPEDRTASLNAVGLAHQYLSKPCELSTLKSVLEQACALRELLTDHRLKQAIARMHTLPSLPAVYHELMRELQWSDASLKGVGRIVARDMAMTAKVLQLVNSAFFGLRQHIADPVQAVIYLGLETLKALALSTQVFSQFDRAKLGHLPLKALQEHCLMVGALAKRIAETERADRQVVDYALAAGLLHDVGKLVLAVNHPQLYDEAMLLAAEQNIHPHEMEKQVFGTSHAEVGAYLLGIWGLPNPIVEALAFHLHPADHLAREFTPLTAVHVANVLAREASPCDGLHDGTSIDMDYLARLPGMAERLPVWRAISQEAPPAPDSPAPA